MSWSMITEDAQGAGELRESGARSRLGVEMGQRGKTAWLGFEIHVEVGDRGSRGVACAQ